MREQSTSPRRISVKRAPGVFYRELASGERSYSFTYRDSTGKQHWQSVKGGLEEAKAAQAAMVGRKHRGEKIEPTRKTFAEAADLWLESKARIRPKTRQGYEWALHSYLLPSFGRKRVHDITEEDIVRLIRELEAKGFSGWTIQAVLTPLSGILKRAIRKGWRSDNPLSNLESDERPDTSPGEQRILEGDEIAVLLDSAPATYAPILRTMLFTGLRFGEALGLKWTDVDLDREIVHARRQLSQGGKLSDYLKTAKARRDVVLFPDLVRFLRAHKLSSPFSKPEDFVFANQEGRGYLQTNVAKRGLDKAAAKLNGNGKPKLTAHDLRHTFASILIREGADVVFVARQLGHANPSITLRIYAHLFDAEKQADNMRTALEARFGGNGVVTSDVEGRGLTGKVAAANVVAIPSGRSARSST